MQLNNTIKNREVYNSLLYVNQSALDPYQKLKDTIPSGNRGILRFELGDLTANQTKTLRISPEYDFVIPIIRASFTIDDTGGATQFLQDYDCRIFSEIRVKYGTDTEFIYDRETIASLIFNHMDVIKRSQLGNVYQKDDGTAAGKRVCFEMPLYHLESDQLRKDYLIPNHLFSQGMLIKVKQSATNVMSTNRDPTNLIVELDYLKIEDIKKKQEATQLIYDYGLNSYPAGTVVPITDTTPLKINVDSLNTNTPITGLIIRANGDEAVTNAVHFSGLVDGKLSFVEVSDGSNELYRTYSPMGLNYSDHNFKELQNRGGTYIDFTNGGESQGLICSSGTLRLSLAAKVAWNQGFHVVVVYSKVMLIDSAGQTKFK